MTGDDDVTLFFEVDHDEYARTALLLFLPTRPLDADPVRCWIGPREGPWRLATATRWHRSDAFQIVALEPAVWYDGEPPTIPATEEGP